MGGLLIFEACWIILILLFGRKKISRQSSCSEREKSMSEKLIVLSMDAMVSEDLAYLKTKPNYARLFEKCAQVEKMCTIYPSVTYPAHASMMTGCRPGKHGIYTNGHFKTGLGRTLWHLESDELQVEDIFAAAKRQGKTTASVYWPITGNNPNIDYLLNEFFFYDNEPIEESFAGFGANEEALQAVRENLHRYPAYDVTVRQADVLTDHAAFEGGYDAILSNPPYIPTGDLATLQREVQREPRMALDGSADGLLFYRAIAEHWCGKLAPDGFCAVEVGVDQAEDVAALFAAAGLENTAILPDLAGIPRVVIARK